MDRLQQISKDSWNKALHAVGTAEIFRRKQRVLSKRLNLLTFLGIAVPAFTGATASGYGVNSEILKKSIYISIPLLIAQLIISIWAAVNTWSSNLAYTYESVSENDRLGQDFTDLAQNPPTDSVQHEHRYSLLNSQLANRDREDDKWHMSEKEKRYGMRFSLRQFQRQCPECKTVPTSLDSTSCNVCGKFAWYNF
jgi:mobilome CxxCx(11)CxxC protein